MKAGRELNELVATKIMGAVKRADGSWRYDDQNYSDIPDYSGSIEAAFQVVGRMYRHPKPVLELFGPQQDYVNEKWRCRFSRKWWSREDSPYIDSSEGDTAAEAICNAALAFFEVKLENTPA